MALQAAAFVDGKSYAAEDVRRLVFAATQGASGVAAQGNLEVSATATPSGNVVVNAGVGYAMSLYAPNQSYIVSNNQAETVAIPPNNTASPVKYEMCIVVNDPQYAGGGTMPSDPSRETFCRYLIQPTLPGSRPYVRLATITLPANTATVTNAMVVDRTSVANPRRDRRSVVSSPGSVYPLSTTYQQWPPGASVPFDVPSWARRMNVRVDLSGVEIVASGYHRAELKPTLDGGSDEQPVAMTVNNQNTQRLSFFTVATFAIPTAKRGGTVQIGLRGAVKVGTSGAFQIDTSTNIVYDVEFLEK